MNIMVTFSIVVFLQFICYINGKLTFIAVGDWGEQLLDDQKEVAAAMGEWAARNKTDFIVSTGDNFYPDGVESPTDPQFNESWRWVYNQTSISNLTWYLCQGNHDHAGYEDGREWHQVTFGKTEPRWYMPSLTYSFVKETGSGQVLFVAVDSMSIRGMKNNFTDMLDFLRSELSTSTAKWKVVYLHRPAYSSGNYFGSDSIRTQVLSVCEQYGVDVFLTGHDHNLQHLQRVNGSDIDFVISGAGGAFIYMYDQDNHQRCQDAGVELRKFVEDYGFTAFTIDGDEMTIEFILRDTSTAYSYVRRKNAK